MQKDRMLAFTDGVFAVIITIMVLDLKIPHGATFDALRPEATTFMTYILSFIYVAIYWNNHHHLFQMTDKTNGAILWANLHLLFWQSLAPFVTGWLGQSGAAGAPAATYGFVLLMSGVAFTILQGCIIRQQGPSSPLREAVGSDSKGKVSLGLYAAGIATSFWAPALAVALCAVPAVIWLIPDRRIESRLT
jgi:uncharacterized membrane protein